MKYYQWCERVPSPAAKRFLMPQRCIARWCVSYGAGRCALSLPAPGLAKITLFSTIRCVDVPEHQRGLLRFRVRRLVTLTDRDLRRKTVSAPHRSCHSNDSYCAVQNPLYFEFTVILSAFFLAFRVH